MLYCRFLLVIYFKYSSVYMSIPNCQYIPPSYPYTLVTINSFSKSVSLFLFRKYGAKSAHKGGVQGCPGCVFPHLWLRGEVQ